MTTVSPSQAPAPSPERDAVAPLGPAVPERRRSSRHRVVFIVLLLVLLLVSILAAAIGQLWIPPLEVVGSISSRVNEWLGSTVFSGLAFQLGTEPTHPAADATLWTIRFPRVVMAMIVGASLAVAGAVMQGIFGNPLAEPGIVGVSSGAAVGACAVIVFGWDFAGPLTRAVLAFVGGLLAAVFVYASSRSGGRTEVITLVLTGIAVNAITGAAIALLTFLGDTQAREQIVFWQLGSLNGTRWQYVAVVLPIMIVGVAACLVLSRRLDLLSLGDRQARHLGVNVERLRIVSIVVVAALTAAAVAMCGVIGFVGLVVPHIMRMILGPGHRALVPASALGGAVLLLLADLVARNAVPYADLPIGMLTAIVGGPFFFWLLRRARKSAGGWA